MRKETLMVVGMSCGHCVASIEGDLSSLAGVIESKVNLVEKNVVVQFNENEVSLDNIKACIEELGYEVK